MEQPDFETGAEEDFSQISDKNDNLKTILQLTKKNKRHVVLYDSLRDVSWEYIIYICSPNSDALSCFVHKVKQLEFPFGRNILLFQMTNKKFIFSQVTYEHYRWSNMHQNYFFYIF